MRTFIIKPGDLIPIGRAGENQATQIRFDVTGWADTFGAGTYTLVVKRPHEDTAYPVEVTTDGDYVVWTVSNVDTGIAGNASVQLRYVVDGALAKSVIYAGIVGESLDNIVDPPDPFEDLIQRMVDLAERTEAAAESAAGSAASASESAETATAAKTAAQTAAQAAQTAQGTATQAAQTATQAKDAAQTAQSSAEAAQSSAASSATAASGSATAAAGSASQAAASATAASGSAAAAASSAAAAQAAAMDVIDKAPIITDTASGAIASFPDGADAPIKQLTVAVNPVQDLHGYDNPWPAGGGKNKLDYTVAWGGVSYHAAVGTVFTLTEPVPQPTVSGNTVTFTIASGWASRAWKTPLLASGSYTVHLDVSQTTNSRMSIYTVDGSTNAVKTAYASTSSSAFTRTVTVDDGDYIIVSETSSTAGTITVKDMQVESGTSYTAWAPYSNDCPITGWAGVEVTRTGRNLLGGLALGQAIVNAVNDSTKSSLGENTDGKYVTIVASYAVSNKVFFNTFKPNTQYTLILRITRYQTGPSFNGNIQFRYTDGSTQVVYFSTTSATDVVTIAKTSDVSKTLKQVETVYGGGTTRLFYEQSGIFEGVVTTDEFEPYTGATYEVEFPSESGTVYGGTVTVNQDGTGTLVAKHSLFTVNSFAGVWGATSNGYAVYTTISGTYRTNAARSSLFAYNGNGYQTMPVWTFCGGSGAQGTVSFILPSTITSKAEANAWLASLDTPLTVYIKRATPVTYTLTAAEMTALLGTNNWWADTGNVTVNYRADTKLYIDKKLAALLAALS